MHADTAVAVDDALFVEIIVVVLVLLLLGSSVVVVVVVVDEPVPIHRPAVVVKGAGAVGGKNCWWLTLIDSVVRETVSTRSDL